MSPNPEAIIIKLWRQGRRSIPRTHNLSLPRLVPNYHSAPTVQSIRTTFVVFVYFAFLLACQVRVTIDNSGLCCCSCDVFRAIINSLCWFSRTVYNLQSPFMLKDDVFFETLTPLRVWLIYTNSLRLAKIGVSYCYVSTARPCARWRDIFKGLLFFAAETKTSSDCMAVSSYVNSQVQSTHGHDRSTEELKWIGIIIEQSLIAA